MEASGSGLQNSFTFYILIFIFIAALVILGYSVQDYSLVILGGFLSILFGLYILFYGIVGLKDAIYTWATGIIILMVGAYFAVRASMEQLNL